MNILQPEANQTMAVLIIDDGSSKRSLSLDTGERKYRARVADSVGSALVILAQEQFEIVLIENVPDNISIRESIVRLRLVSPYTEIIVVTDSADEQAMADFIEVGACDCLVRPCLARHLLARLGCAAERSRMRRELTARREEIAMSCALDNLVGTSEAMRRLQATIKRIASTDIPIFISGSPGTGKSLLARIIHYHSYLRRGPLVTVDCAADYPELLEMTFFGDSTISRQRLPNGQKPAIEKADNGTLVLEAIDRMPPQLQSRFMGFLQDFKIPVSRDGATRKVDLRTIAVSRLIPSQLAEQGFKENLLNRMSVMELVVPPLADRTEDIELLTDYFIRRFLGDKRPLIVSPEALQKLCRYQWPGNVTELESTLKNALARSDQERLEADHILIAGSSLPPAVAPVVPDRLLEENQQAVINKSLIDNDWNFTRTAQALGIGRTTLWRKVKKYQLRQTASVNPGDDDAGTG
ncbi:MAG: sigma 54-interacting transcriptional regulator [bacterium]